MGGPTERVVEKGIKYGTVFAEVSSILPYRESARARRLLVESNRKGCL